MLPAICAPAIPVLFWCFAKYRINPLLFRSMTELMGINDTFKALADPTRREILRLLKDRDMTAGEIADNFALSRPTMSGHFNVLRAAGLIVSERNRTKIVYSINTSAFEDAFGSVLGLFRGTEQADEDTGLTDAQNRTGEK